MFDENKKEKDKKGGVNPIMAGVTGAVVGAGVAVAASQALKDKKNRDRVKKTLTDVKDQTMEYVQNFRTDSEVKEKTKELKKVAKKVGKK